MSITNISVKHPVLMKLLMLLVIIGGIFSYFEMPQDRFPDVSVETIMVTTILPGASPKEIEQLITIPLEEEIAKVDQIKEMTSTSSDGSSTIVLEMESGIDNFFEKLTEVQNQIEMVQDFPEEAEPPVVREMKVAFETLSFSLLGAAPEHEIKEFVEDIEAELKNVPGVEEVGISGVREREIWVEADPHRLYAYGLSLADVSAALARRNLNLPGGTIRMGRGEFNVRTEAEFVNTGHILDTVLKEDGENGYVYVRDVATVSDTFEERRSRARFNGQPSINISVKKDRISNAIHVVEDVRRVMEEYEPRLPAGLSMVVVEDSSVEIRERLNSLTSNLWSGLAMVMLTITLFIGWRPALMVAFGMPVAMIGTFIFLNAIGYSINVLVLFGLILVSGIVCDDAIIVCDNVYRYIEAGLPIHQAVIRGVDEVTWPVLATVVTTVSAFIPLLLMTGVLGEFMGVIPVVVSIALLCSLVETFLFLPMHIHEWAGPPPKKKGADHRPWYTPFVNAYAKLIVWALKIRYLTVAAAIGVAVFAVNLAYTRMDFILFGGRDLESFSLELEAPPGASLMESDRILRELEEHGLVVAARTPEIESVTTNAGTVGYGPMGGASGSNMGQLIFSLVPEGEREKSGRQIKDEVRAAIQDVAGARSMTFEDARNGPPVGKAIQVRVKGDNFDTLKTIAEEIKDYLRTVDGVKDVMDNFPPGKDEVRPSLDLDKVAALGLDVRRIATEVRGAFDGIEATKVHDGNEEIDVMVKYNAASSHSLSEIDSMAFPTPNGMTHFRNFGSVERREGVSTISHHNQIRAINVLADVAEGKITSAKANALLLERFKDIGDRYPGYHLDFGGEFEDTQDSLNSLFKAFIIAIIAIYVILGGLFSSFVQPFVVMFAVPFSFIGVVFGFFLMDEPLGMFAIIGIIALSGIVTNDSLVLMEFINKERRSGKDRRSSIVTAGVTRLRAIFLTSVTTTIGLMPTVFGWFGVDQFLRPMATSIAWGLSFATVLTLIVIPCVYSIFDDFAMLIARRPLGFTREEWRTIQEGQASPVITPAPIASGGAGAVAPAQAQLSVGAPES